MNACATIGNIHQSSSVAQRAQVWLKELKKQYIPGSKVIWLIGNKGDLAQDRQVSVQVSLLAYRKIIFFSIAMNFYFRHRLTVTAMLNDLQMALLFLFLTTYLLQEGQSLAYDRDLFFTETSALTADQVSELLLAVGKFNKTDQRCIVAVFSRFIPELTVCLIFR